MSAEDTVARLDRLAEEDQAQARAFAALDGIREPAAPVSLGDLLAMELPERRCIMAPWLPERGLCLVSAGRGMGKTFFCLSAGLAIAGGENFLCWKTPNPRRVLYIDGEMAAEDMRERLNNLLKTIPAASRDLAFENFSLLSDMLTEHGIPPLSDPLHHRWYQRACKGADLVIVDNLATVCRGGDENEAASWAAVQEWAIGQRREGRSVLFVHHAGKNGQQRGTSAREDVLNTSILLTRPDGYNPAAPCHFRLAFTKARGFYGPDAADLDVCLQDIDGKPTWTASTAKDADQQLVDDVLDLKLAGKSVRDIAAELEATKSKVHRILKANGY